MIEPTLHQYTTLGDAGNITDNKYFVDPGDPKKVTAVGSGKANTPDDRWVFTEDNPERSFRNSGIACCCRAGDEGL